MKIDFKKKISWPVALISIILTLFVIIVIDVIIVWPTGYSNEESNNINYQNNQDTVVKPIETLGVWMKDFETTHPDNECANKVATQITYFKNEKLSNIFVFDKYKITEIQTTNFADLNTNSNKYANEFRTAIRGEMDAVGVNFAGHYSIVSVGMTGYWTWIYYIIDRKNGKAFIFPYGTPMQLDFHQNSNLIIFNPKDTIWSVMEQSSDYTENCEEVDGPIWPDLRPIYFLWQNDKLIQLGPKDIKPIINPFWTNYFK